MLNRKIFCKSGPWMSVRLSVRPLAYLKTVCPSFTKYSVWPMLHVALAFLVLL